jgi:hypothetical protein
MQVPAGSRRGVMGIQIGSDVIYMSEPNFIVDVGICVAGSTGHLSWTKDYASRQIVKIRQVPSSSTPISAEVIEEFVHGAWGLNVNIALV